MSKENNKIEASQDFLRRPPNWMMRWGNLLIFLFFGLLITFSFVIKYNETIEAEVLVTSENPPVDLFSKTSGKLVYMNYESGKKAFQNEVLAVIENPSNHDDVFYLKNQLTDSSAYYSSIKDLYEDYPSNLDLQPEIHVSYQKFLESYQDYILYVNLNAGEQESENINSRISRLKRQIRLKESQLNRARRSYQLSKQSNQRQNELFTKGVISKQELDFSEQELLIAGNNVNKIIEELESLKVDTLSLGNLSAKSSNRDIINASKFSSNVQLAKQELIGKINQWESKYALISPIDGTITVYDVWNNFQNVEEGEQVVTIVPFGNNKIIGKCKVPIHNSAKLKVGQDVVIKLDNYPYAEWGFLEGKVMNISETPKKAENLYYSIYVNVPDFVTSYGNTLEFKNEMAGSAKIILQETSLIERVFYQFRGIWSNLN